MKVFVDSRGVSGTLYVDCLRDLLADRVLTDNGAVLCDLLRAWMDDAKEVSTVRASLTYGRVARQMSGDERQCVQYMLSKMLDALKAVEGA